MTQLANLELLTRIDNASYSVTPPPFSPQSTFLAGKLLKISDDERP